MSVTAAATPWLPCLLPPVLGLLRGCSHCVGTYWKMSALAPGVIAPVLLLLDDLWFGVGGTVATLAALGVLYLAAREMPRRLLYGVAVVAMLAVGFEAVGLSHALRA